MCFDVFGRQDNRPTKPQIVQPFIPDEIVGGIVPYFPGHEREAVWYAATQACQTDDVRFVYTVARNRCWYLATRSALLASSPDSWCPIALALPQEGNDLLKNTVYTYAQNGRMAALYWDSSLQAFHISVGETRGIGKELMMKDADIIVIDAAAACPMPWEQRERFTAEPDRLLSWIIVIAGLAGAIISLMVMVTASSQVTTTPALEQPTLSRGARATETGAPTDASTDVWRIMGLLDAIYTAGGTLVRYEVSASGTIEWEALVPPSFSFDDSAILGTVVPVGNVTEDGRIRVKGSR